MPSPLLPEMRLPAPASRPPGLAPAAPPIRLSWVPLKIATPAKWLPRRAADGVVGGGVEDRHAGEGVAQGGGAGGVGADEVAPHHVAARGAAGDLDAVAGVGGDDVPLVGAAAADLVAGGAGGDLDAVA